LIRCAKVVGAVLALAAVPQTVFAVSPKFWIHDTAAEFMRGDPVATSVTKDGSLRLGPKIEMRAETEEPYIWDVALDSASGDVYLGTGDDGIVLRVRGEKSSRFFQCAALEVLSLTVGKDGMVYAGTAPEGFVYRIGRDGQGDILFDADEDYVWDLEFGPDGKLYASVGPGGAVYRIDPAKGTAERFFETDDNHVVCLAFEANGNLLLGTEGRGLVVRVTPGGDAEVLYDCPQGEVGAVLSGSNGDVWAAASSAAPARETSRKKRPDTNGDGSEQEEMPLEDEMDYSFEIMPLSAGDGVLYRVDADGNAFRHWESGQGAIYDLATSAAGTVLAVTGDEGAIFEIGERGSATLLAAMDAEQVVRILPGGKSGDYLVATASPSKLFTMTSESAREGTFTSEVLDARYVARWGRIEWLGEDGGGKVTLALRTGNTDEPDGTWTEWSRELDGSSAAVPDRRPTRFLQWRATLTRGKDSPFLRRVRVSSLENNLPPVVENVEVIPMGTRFYDEVPEIRPRPVYQSLPGGTNVQYQFDQRAIEEYPPEHRSPWTQGLRQVRWEAADPNGDFLVSDLAYRREDETRWKTFAEEVEGTTYTFNSKGVPDGMYRLRVIASDRRFNPENERTTFRDSEPFYVDNTAPGFEMVTHERHGGEIRVTATLFDDLSDVVRLEISLDGGEWEERAPSDGIFDSRRERIEFSVPAAVAEEHSVLLRGTDLAGNLGTTRILIRP
jgi:hypothetical protein